MTIHPNIRTIVSTITVAATLATILPDAVLAANGGRGPSGGTANSGASASSGSAGTSAQGGGRGTDGGGSGPAPYAGPLASDEFPPTDGPPGQRRPPRHGWFVAPEVVVYARCSNPPWFYGERPIWRRCQRRIWQ